MEQTIEHTYLKIRGLSLHIAHTGSKGGKGTVVFLHGFPEIWYTWRHQMVAVAEAGYSAIAPDFRGYGLSEQPPEPEDATWEDLVADLLAILDHLQIPKAYIVGKDFGAPPAYLFALRHSDRVSGVVTLGVPFLPHEPDMSLFPEGFYVRRWRQPGRAEADFGRFDVKTVIRNIYILFSGNEIPIASEDEEIMDLVKPSDSLPTWFTEEDLKVYVSLYEKSGFKFALQMPYRSKRKLEVTDDLKIDVPVMFIMGEKDYVLKFAGMEDYIRSGTLKHFVPNLDVTFIPEGTHFVHEQLPNQVNQLIVSFLDSHILV